MITIDIDNAAKVAAWIRDGRGVARWRSHDLSDPSAEVYTPAKKKDASEFLKLGIQKSEDQPGWKYPEIHEIETDPEKMIVKLFKEVKRFHVGLKQGSGFGVVLSDASNRKLKRLLNEIPGSHYQFDYERQDAVIVVPDKVTTLKEWMNENTNSETVQG